MTRRARTLAAALVLTACAGGAATMPGAPAVPEADRGAPPPAAAAVRLPATVDFRLANGMRVFLVPDPEVPLASFHVRVAGGSIEDPEGAEGATALLAALLTKGAGDRDAKAFQEAVDFVGGTFSADVAPRWLSVRAEFLSKDADLALDLLADVLQRPRLAPEEFEKERGLAIDSIQAAREAPNGVIDTYFDAWLWSGHPFARPPGGDERTLAALSIERVKEAAARALAPARAWMAVGGDFDPAEMRRAIESRFGGWTAEAPAPRAVPPVPRAPERGVLLVDKPDSLQTYFRFGGPGMPWTHPDWPARHLANTILGGRFTSRLNKALRIDSGLTYGASSGFDDSRLGAFTVRSYTETARSEATLALAAEVYRRFTAEGITAEELESARNYVKGQFTPDRLETADQVAAMVLALEFEGVPRGRLDTFFERLDALDVAEVNRVIRAACPASPLLWVVIGQAEKLRPLLARYGTVTECRLADPGFGPGFQPARSR